MKHLKLLLLLLVHLCCTVMIQFLLLRLLLRENDPGHLGIVRFALYALSSCLADLIVSCFLLKGIRIGRKPYILVQFWDLSLICPVLVIAFLGLFSDSLGLRFSLIALLFDLMLIIERSTCFVLYDPRRSFGDE